MKRYIPLFYVAILFMLAAARLFQKISTDTGGFTSRYAPMITVCILLVAALGLVNKKPFIERLFWQILYSFLVVVSFVAFSLSIYFYSTSNLPLAYMLIIGAILLIPACLILYHYVYTHTQIWDK